MSVNHSLKHSNLNLTRNQSGTQSETFNTSNVFNNLKWIAWGKEVSFLHKYTLTVPSKHPSKQRYIWFSEKLKKFHNS